VIQGMWTNEFGPGGTANGGIYADKSYWICTENWPGQNYPIDVNVYNQFGGFGTGYVPNFAVVGANYKVYYNTYGFTQANLEAAIRLAINEMPAPGNAILSDSSFSPTTAPDTSVYDSFNIVSNGAGPINYSFSIDYDGTAAAGSIWHSNNFESGIVYTNTNWVAEVGGTWNGGTMCADAKDKATSVMTSAAFNTIGVGDRLWLEFRYGTAYQTGSSLKAEYFNGTSWVVLWTFQESGVGTEKIELPVHAANTQLRFTAVSTFVAGTHSIERLDDIKVYSDDQAYRWLLFDQVNSWGEPTEVGTIPTGTNKDFNLTFDATGLAEGTYNANILVTCSDPEDSPFTIPVVFTVAAGGPVTPAVPANVTTSIVGGNVYVNWDNSADATSYDVYSSATPYGTFAFLTNVTTSEYTYTPTATKMFFYIVAKNATKESPKSIIVK